MALEIERRFLLEAMPQVPSDARVERITQHYLFATDKMTMRVRHIAHVDGDRYRLTFKEKVGPGVSEEYETDISGEDYERSARNAIASISKTRTTLPYGKYALEIDQFDIDPELLIPHYGRDRLIIAEVELPRRNAALRLKLDVPFQEITGEDCYSNITLALVAAGKI